MDDSQSSDCFPESADISFRSIVPMDTTSYESLVASTKQTLNAGIKGEIQRVAYSTYFTTLLEDCASCINQSLELVTRLISNTEVCIATLSKYLNDAVCLLQLLSDFIKTVVESVSMACCSMKTFPNTTGLIIISVFTHCKDSESLYGSTLGSVEKQLKDLFKSCHELQLTYLMILEKHFIFDLTEMEEKDTLVEALDINLKIGEIVQCLDVKTMAEQWKAYTMICEKYSAVLSEMNTFQDCTQVLCMLIKNNIKIAVEKNQDDKIAVRSLKVASFTTKILLKTCNIFRHATRKDYVNVIDLLFFIHEIRLFHLETTAEKSQFTNLIVSPFENLLKELLSDDIFGYNLLSFDIEKIENEDKLLGFVFTMTSVMKYLTQGQMSKTVTKSKLITCIYSILPHCHIWNLDLSLRSESNQLETHGLFEHLLIHTASLAFTLNSEEYCLLERNMAEAILGTDCYSALFSSSIWVLMARHVSSQLHFNQIIWLCTMYKKLENHKMFHRSPQKVHLRYTISRLFEVMEDEDKMKICKQFRIHDDDNVSLWIALGVNNLPDEVQCAAEEVVAEKLKTQLQSFNGSHREGIHKVIKVVNLAATCTFANTKGIEHCVIKAWSKTCLKHQFAIHNLDNSTVWFFDYLQALVFLTDSTWHRMCENSANLTKVLHLITSLIQQCCTEFRLILINTLCKLAACSPCESKLDAVFTEAFTCLFQDSEDIVRNKLFITMREYRRDKNIDRILSNIEDDSLRESWFNIKDGKDCRGLDDLKAMNSKYTHKCFESGNMIQSSSSSVSELKKESSSNFEFADIDNLFGNDNDSDLEQPVSKKFKLDAGETEAIVKRLETDASLLCNVKENVFSAEYINRIQNVCDKLRNIID